MNMDGFGNFGEGVYSTNEISENYPTYHGQVRENKQEILEIIFDDLS